MLHRRHVADRRVLHVEIVLADEDDRQLPDRREIERLVERADIGGAVAEETDRDVLFAEILRAPRRAAGNRQVRADDRVGAHHAVLDRGQMHRAALAAHAGRCRAPSARPARPPSTRRARACARGRGRCRTTSRPSASRRRSPPRRPPARATDGSSLDQVLQEEIECALLAVANFHLEAEELQTAIEADVVVLPVILRRASFREAISVVSHPTSLSHELARERDVSSGKIFKLGISRTVPRNLSDFLKQSTWRENYHFGQMGRPGRTEVLYDFDQEETMASASRQV